MPISKINEEAFSFEEGKLIKDADLALEKLNHGTEVFKFISPVLLAKDKFIAQAMFINPCIYWEANFPEKHRNHYPYLIKAMNYQVDSNILKKLQKSLQNDERIVKKFFLYNYLEALNFYFPKTEVADIYPEDQKKSTKIYLYRFLSNQEDPFYDYLYQYDFSYRMLGERKIWCHTLRMRKDKAGLDVVFARLTIGHLRKIQEMLVQAWNQNKSEDRTLLELVNDSIKERRHGRVWRVTGRLFGVKWTLRV